MSFNNNASKGLIYSSNMKNRTGRYVKTLLVGFTCLFLAAASGCGQAKVNKAVSSTASHSSSENSSSIVPSSSSSAASSEAQASSAGNTARRVICIDPGHQAKVDLSEEAIAPNSNVMKTKNPGGTEGVVTKLPEYKLNLEVALKLEQQLKSLGYQVVMTRDNNDGDISNIGRAQVANNCNADMFVRIHADGVDQQSANGISVLYPGGQYISDTALLTQSKKVAQDLLDGMVASTGANNRKLSERSDMTGFNWCTRPMALIEMGFMSNPDEDQKMSTDAYQNELVTGMVNGINKYFYDKDHGN
jgi:N-acetylmuramoyl-L-alanine amidase